MFTESIGTRGRLEIILGEKVYAVDSTVLVGISSSLGKVSQHFARCRAPSTSAMGASRSRYCQNDLDNQQAIRPILPTGSVLVDDLLKRQCQERLTPAGRRSEISET